MVTVLGLPTDIMQSGSSMIQGEISNDELIKMAHSQAIEQSKEEDPTKDYKNTFAELKGAKLLWHVHSQSEINPSHVFNPREKAAEKRKLTTDDF